MTLLGIRDYQLEMDESASQHTSETKDDDGAECNMRVVDGSIIITEHTERFVNILHGMHSCL